MDLTGENVITRKYTIDPHRINLGKLPGLFHINDFDELLPLSEKQKRHIANDWGGYLFEDHVEAARLVLRRKIGEPMTIAIRKIVGGIKGINTAGLGFEKARPARKLLTQLTKACGGCVPSVRPQQSANLRFGGVLNPRTCGSTFPHSLDHARASYVHTRTAAISLRSSINNAETGIFSMMLCRFGKNPIDGRKCLQRYTLNYYGEEIIDVDYANTFRNNNTNSHYSCFIASHIGHPGGSTGSIVRVHLHLENCEGIFNIGQHGEMEIVEGNLSPTGIQYLQGQAVIWMQKAYEFNFLGSN